MRARLVLLTLLSVLASMGAQHRTANFVVTAQTPQIAQTVGQWAEHYRREKALQWLNYEMPAWQHPCPLHVIVEMSVPQGKTSFHYMNHQVSSMNMEIQGPLDSLIKSVLPHEITHTVFAHYFGCPVPRWADEGGSVLSEDNAEQIKHDHMTRDSLNKGRRFRLRTLMSLTEYPADSTGVMLLYAQGYSLSDYLVKRNDRRTFLAFVAHGMRTQSWDRAVHDFYGMRSVEDLEDAWLKNLSDTRRGQPDLQIAKNTRPADNAKPKTYERTTLPPAQPLDAVPVFRGAAPGGHYGDAQTLTMTPPINLPTTPVKSNWTPTTAAAPAYLPAGVQLGSPQFIQPYYPQSQYAQPQYSPAAGQGQCSSGQCQTQPYYSPQYNNTPPYNSTPATFGYPR